MKALSAERVGILGGSLDPVHNRHIEMAEAALRQLHLDRVLFLPSGMVTHKAKAPAPVEDRLEMLRLALIGKPELQISRLEADAPGPTYTVDTLRKLRGELPEAKFYFLLGEDLLSSLSNWFEAEALFGYCSFAVCPRSGSHTGDEMMRLREKGADLVLLELPPQPASSTAVREAFRLGGSAGDLPPQVSEYIRMFGLYGTPSSPKDARTLYPRVKAVLPEKRFLHSVLVASYARHLASVHGEDPEKAALAGLLHDCAKAMPLSEMQRIARSHFLRTDEETFASGNLLHGPVGAILAKKEYGVTDPAVFSAIECHTTGKIGMTPFDMILFLADKLELSRKPYPGLETLRDLAEKDLVSAMLLSLNSTLEYVQSTQGKPPHPLTGQVAAWLTGCRNAAQS